jgi:hypothetical protein
MLIARVPLKLRGYRGRDRMVVGFTTTYFTTTYAISAYHH